MNLKTKVTALTDQLEQKNPYYLLGGVLLTIFLVFYFVIMHPQLRTLRTINPKITTLTRDLKQAKDNIARIKDYQREAETLRVQYDKTRLKIIPPEEVPKVLEDLSRLANQAQIKFNQLVPLKEAQEVVLSNTDGTFSALPISVEAHGGYHDLGRFINQVEQQEAFLNIKDMQIASYEDEKKELLIRLTIQTIVRQEAPAKK